MKKRRIDCIESVDELKNRIRLVDLQTLNEFDISGLNDVKMIDNKLYAYWNKSDGGVVDRVRYKYIDGSIGEHVFSGTDLNDLYRDIEFFVASYIFGVVNLID